MTLVRKNPPDGLDGAGPDGEELDRFYYHPEHEGWGQPLFAALSATAFLILLAAATAVAILYSQGGIIPGPKI